MSGDFAPASYVGRFPMDQILGLPRAPRPPTIDGKVTITPYALDDGEWWFAALRFSLRGFQLGDDLVLRERPCTSANEAKAVADHYVAEAYK